MTDIPKPEVTFDNWLEGMTWEPYQAKFLGYKHYPDRGVYQNDGDYDRLAVGEVYTVKGSPQTIVDAILLAVDIEPLAVLRYPVGNRPEEEWEQV